MEVEGLGEYIVQDRPAQWVIDKYGENQIDIYFDNHEAASAFGLKQLKCLSERRTRKMIKCENACPRGKI